MEVLIFGTGSFMKKVREVLKKNIDIVAFIDNDKKVEYIDNIPVIIPSEINSYEYDVIIIASMYDFNIYQQLLSLNVCNKKIIDFYNIIHNKNAYYLLFKYKLSEFLDLEDAEGIITGSSYYKYGINSDILKDKIYNFAWDSEDLFYDYMMAKHLIDNCKSNLKYAFIGLGIYSFQYDISKSELAYDSQLFGLMYAYNKVLGSWHNMVLDSAFNNVVSKYDFVFNLINEEKINILTSDYKNCWNRSENKNILIEDPIYLNNYAKKLNKKNYKETEEENKEIFRKYIKMLLSKNIQPIVMLFPFTISLNSLISQKMKDNFYNIIYELKKEFNFMFLDYSKLELDNSNFYDYEHLNNKGASYITNVINKDIFSYKK